MLNSSCKSCISYKLVKVLEQHKKGEFLPFVMKMVNISRKDYISKVREQPHAAIYHNFNYHPIHFILSRFLYVTCLLIFFQGSGGNCQRTKRYACLTSAGDDNLNSTRVSKAEAGNLWPTICWLQLSSFQTTDHASWAKERSRNI